MNDRVIRLTQNRLHGWQCIWGEINAPPIPHSAMPADAEITQRDGFLSGRKAGNEGIDPGREGHLGLRLNPYQCRLGLVDQLDAPRVGVNFVLYSSPQLVRH